VDQATLVQSGQIYVLQPFRLDAESASRSIEFEAPFLLDGVLYRYRLTIIPQLIVSEHLLVYKALKPERRFERHADADTGKDVQDFSAGAGH
jgi:hypothetical protein